jgi:aspartate/methionine/tyrosine aminotransferase
MELHKQIASNIKAKYKQRADLASKKLKAGGFKFTEPDAPFYVFPKIRDIGSRWKTDLDFVLHLLKETCVLTVNGSGFDPVYGKDHARIVFLPPCEMVCGLR